MKTRYAIIIAAMLIAVALVFPAVSAGNGIDQNGPHYNLNIIAKTNAKAADYNAIDPATYNGHVIFCPLNKGQDVTCRIYLAEGEDFQVLDPNGTDGVARFMLPRPYAEGEDVTNDANAAYRIYIRVLGKPGGSGKITTGLCNVTDSTGPKTVEEGAVCLEDAGLTWMSASYVPLASHSPNDKGNPNQKFVDVTHELTTVDLSAVGYGHVGLFDSDPFGTGVDGDFLYFWDLVNRDMKNIQLRFYPVVETVG